MGGGGGGVYFPRKRVKIFTPTPEENDQYSANHS
jgi:hypothetical protein